MSSYFQAIVVSGDQNIVVIKTRDHLSNQYVRQSATMAEGRGEKMIVLLILTIACVGFGVSIPQNNHRRTRRGIVT